MVRCEMWVLKWRRWRRRCAMGLGHVSATDMYLTRGTLGVNQDQRTCQRKAKLQRLVSHRTEYISQEGLKNTKISLYL